MEEEEVRLALLQIELNTIQNSIKSLDTITFQIKGWCITTSLAVGGFALAYHKPALLLVGAGAVLSFFLINCQFKMFQRGFINRNLAIDSELRNAGIMQVLKGVGSLDIVGTGAQTYIPASGSSVFAKIRSKLPSLWFEASKVNTFSLYLFVGLLLMVEGIVLLL